jgi:hypothetical protein
LLVVVEAYIQDNFFFPKKADYRVEKATREKELTRNLWIRHVHSREKRFQGSRGVAYL